MISAQKTINSLLAYLTPRQSRVIESRFGLGKGREIETLAAIGDKINITRERVRQIEKSALIEIKQHISKDVTSTEIVNRLVKYIKSCGGVVRKDALLSCAKEFVEGIHDNHIAFLLEGSAAFFVHQEDKDFHPFYYADKESLQTAKVLINDWILFLKNKKSDALSGLYKKHLEDFIRTKGIAKTEAEHMLSVTKKIHSNPFGDIGLSDWPEIKPKTTRDRIYLVLKKKKKPLHFEEITKAINEAKLSAQLALAPTVHNELIKDLRFVLVGRGMYGLKEHGYEPGIARDVIHKILKKHGPLSPEEIIQKVNEQRFFKPNTIIINLQNKSFFERLPDGNYRVQEA